MIGVISVIAMDNYFLEVGFENGETKYVDFKPFLSRGGLIKALIKKENFNKVSVLPDGDGIVWSNGVDMSGFDLYEIGAVNIPKQQIVASEGKLSKQLIEALKKAIANK